jgi:4-aminobutyrate aminotransferase-like enzyme
MRKSCRNRRLSAKRLAKNSGKKQPGYQRTRQRFITAFDFPDAATRAAFIDKGLENNIMYLGCGERTIRFRPALIIEKEHIDEGLFNIEKILPSL